MPRTFKATVVLIITLIALTIVTIVNVVQTNSTQETVLSMQQKIQAIEKGNEEIAKQLESGISVSGLLPGATGGGSAQDYYDSAFDDPDNLLKRPDDIEIPADAQYGGTLRRALSDTPKGFNWITENSADVSNIQFLVNDAIARRDFKNPDEFVGQLAYKVTVNDEKTVYTVHLRKGVMWHTPSVDYTNPDHAWMKEPHELTSEDFKFTYDLYKNPQVDAGASKNYFNDMEKVEIIDKYTFKVYWTKRIYNSLEVTIGVSPMPKWLFTKDERGEPLEEATLGLKFNNHWAAQYAVGTGPYSFKEMRAGEHVILEKFPQYYGKRYPIDRIEFIIIKDPDAIYIKLKAGEIDFGGIPQTRYKSEILNAGPDSPFKTGKMKYKLVDTFGYSYIGWNEDKPFFKDKLVRRAMTMAMDREGLVKRVFNGLGTVQTGSFFYQHPGNSPNVKPWPYNLDEARKLLEESGWVDTDNNGIRDKIINGEKVEFSFTILSFDSPTYRSALSIYKEALRKIGVQMSPQILDWPTLQKRMNEKDFDAFTGGWALDWAIDPYQLWHSSQADIPKGSNFVSFRNKEADEIIETLRVTFDMQKRLELMHKFHELLHEEQPYTFLFARKLPIAWRDRLENVVTNKIRPQFTSLPWFLNLKEKEKK